MIENPKHEFQLIEGEFLPDEAMKLLMSLLNNKINYHQLESFSNQIRIGKEVLHSQKRVDYLKQSIEDIKKIINEAEQKGKQLNIGSVIQITFS